MRKREWPIAVCGALMLALLAAKGATPAASKPAEDPAKARREMRLQQALRNLVADVYRQGAWPEHATAGGDLLYTRPKSEGLNEPIWIGTWMTIVLHEPMEKYPDGIWIGYADGHTEFVKDSATLAAYIKRSDAFRVANEKPSYSPEQLARMARGRAMQEVLLAALEQAYANHGAWPEPLARGDGWQYTRPRNVSDPLIATAVVALQEPLGRHADGAWVGYADGHMEFVHDAAGLASCQWQEEIARKAVLVRDALRADAMQPRPTAPRPVTGALQLKLLDPQGNTMSGAKIGQIGVFGDLSPTFPHTCFIEPENNYRAVISDSVGAATIKGEQVFTVRFTDRPVAPIWILDEERGLGAYEEVKRSDFAVGTTREISLRPLCKVSCDIDSVGLQDAERHVVSVYGEVFKPGEELNYTLEEEAIGSRFEYLLPPGDYCLSLRATFVSEAYRFVHIEPGRRELHMEIDLEPDVITRLVGRPAPELREIKGWKGGKPVTLESLHGKLVLLDFWGYWCGACIHSMPALMKLHEQFKDQGLVIIAVHDDSVASVAEYEQKMEPIRRERWEGRDLPFLVALDGGGERRITGSALTAKGATTALYGIEGFPTSILIGRDGRVLGAFEPDSESAPSQIRRLLAAPDAK